MTSSSDDNEIPPYEYAPLRDDEIRLLELSPGGAAELIVKLKTVQLQQSRKLHYEALSYCWGTSLDRVPLSVAPLLWEENLRRLQWGKRTLRRRSTLLITEGLAQALIHLQFVDSPRTLWIDAICINQKSDEEKSRQVKRMAEIYQQATRVVIWLGPGDDTTRLAVATLGYLAAQIEVDFRHGIVKAAKTAPKTWAMDTYRLPYDEQVWESLLHLFSSPWFERLWVWQEAHANPDETIVLCGIERISWLSLRKATIALQANRLVEHPELNAVLYPACLLAFEQQKSDIFGLLLLTSECKCADPRDRIYALLGLLTEETRLGIIPDYSLSTDRVYKSVMVHVHKLYSSLNMLRYCIHTEKDGSLPSWVPDWRRVGPEELHKRTSIYGLWASLSAPPEATLVSESELRVSGIDVGTVTSTKSLELLESQAGMSLEAQDHFWRTLDSILLSIPKVPADTELEDLLKTLCCNDLFVQVEAPENLHILYKDVVQYFLRRIQCLQRGTDPSSKNDISDDSITTSPLSIFRRSVGLAAHAQVLFETRDGIFGLGSNVTRVGDRMCVVLGCKSPLVIRPVGDNKWSVISSCYSYAFACGQALIRPLPKTMRAAEYLSSEGTRQGYIDINTGHFQVEDPRLEGVPLPSGWAFDDSDSNDKLRFLDTETGQSTHVDPRLTREFLSTKCSLRTFDLM